MSAADSTVGQPKYYDPGEVEAYIADATTTIRNLQARLQETAQRADRAEQALGENRPETASLGRALLLASDVADKTISDADARAAELIRDAEERATAIITEARTEADRVLAAARDAAGDVFHEGEARLLAAVNAFVEGTDILRAELGQVGFGATDWRSASRTTANDRPITGPASSPEAPTGPDGATRPAKSPYADLPGGIHNRAYRGDAPNRNAAGDGADVPQLHPRQPPTADNGSVEPWQSTGFVVPPIRLAPQDRNHHITDQT